MLNRKEINELFRYYLTRTAEPIVYKYGWFDDFQTYLFNQILNDLSKIINFNKLTKEDMEILGFGKWNDESDLMLIPSYLYSIIPKGLEVISINGDHIIIDGSDIDNDSGFWLLPYGLFPYDENKSDN